MRRAIARLAVLAAIPTVVSLMGMAQSKVTVPAGMRLLIRMVDSVDSSRNQLGYRFTAYLETNLQVDDLVVAPRGSTVYGRLANAKSAGSMSGGAGLTLELTDIVINGTAYPLLTSMFEVRSKGQGERTAGRVVGGAGLGALIGGLAGGGRGAAIGAAAGGATGTVVSRATPGTQVAVPNRGSRTARL